MINNIWGTVEADAWSRSFSYADYIRLCQAKNNKPISIKAYVALCDAFHQAMDDDLSILKQLPADDPDFKLN